MTARMFLSHPLVLILGSAFLYITLSDAPAYAWPLGFVALVPFFLFLYRESSLRRSFWYGWLFGAIAVAGTITWFLGTYPLEWAGVGDQRIAAVIVVSVWALTSVFLGAFFGLFALLFKRLSHGDSRDIVIVSSLWILTECARAWALSGVFLGTQSSLGPDWIFGFFGYSLGWSHLFMLLAPLGGVYLVAFVGVAINYGMCMLLIRWWHTHALVLLVGLIACIGAIYSVDQAVASVRADQDSSGATATVALVTTDFPASFTDSLSQLSAKAATIEDLLAAAVLGKADIIVLPEDSRAIHYLGAERIQNILAHGRKEILLIDSSRSPEAGRSQARVSFYSTEARSIVGESSKSFLMPFGEYLPYVAAGVARFFGQQEWLAGFNEVREYQKGESRAYSFQGHSLGVLFCSEIIPDAPYRSLARAGVTIFLNVASHADFHEHGGVLYNQTLSIAKMKSAAHHRYFIQAGNHMPSFLINERGDVLMESARGEQSVLFADVKFNTDETPYTRYGDWMLLVALAAVGVALKRVLHA